MDEIARLFQLLQEQEQRFLEEEQRFREDKQCFQERMWEETQRLQETRRIREETKRLREKSQPQVLQGYLQACHSLSLRIQTVTSPSSTTQGVPTNTTGWIFPRRIVPWHDFAAKQKDIWDRLSTGRSFSSKPIFPAQNQLVSRRSTLSDEWELRSFEDFTVQDAVCKLFDAAYDDPPLRPSLNLQGKITFESYPDYIYDDNSTPATRRKARGKGDRAQHYYICQDAHGRSVPVLAIEYIPPHKLSKEAIRTGLQSEIELEWEAIHEDRDKFASKGLAVTVVTQLYSYMIGKGVQYGYICTGEVFVFLFIPEDSTLVFYYVSEPNVDVVDSDENRLHHTAVSQVFAFTLQAILAGPPPQSWHDAAGGLGPGDAELHDIPIDKAATTEFEDQVSPYEGQKWKGFKQSPIRMRSGSSPHPRSLNRQSDDEDEDDKSSAPSPSPNQPNRLAYSSTTSLGTGTSTKDQVQGDGRSFQGGRQKIQDRPFCTQQCLLGLTRGGPMDATCPNIKYHKLEHIDPSEFVRLVRDQLAKDRGRDQDCAPLHLAGSFGTLFKVRLSSHGYTLVAKGMEQLDLPRLEHEHAIYERLQPIQGQHVPVCLGMTHLVLPYYYDCGVYTDFLFLSWGGLRVYECVEQLDKPDAIRAVEAAYASLHELGVLHCGAELRNILYDAQTRNIMIIDFEKAAAPDRQAPSFTRLMLILLRKSGSLW
ncbi:hypothetical protein F4821DRAFT_280999 [Hypoxylon rubiginosum]|uniref:Uncharacterized protein n=1 Tax=Hypoxylon rubiginosum TaxID=110542 RepID=A0ACC0CSF1_9PEZI|nr:hypothetical protein F4821DRAFT_280999 [Hypoxylon rubiginosum]